MNRREFFRLPVVSARAEYLVIGHLMRRNVLVYKAPPGNERPCLSVRDEGVRSRAILS